MISWIQNHLIRHGRWIFLTLLGVIIVAFVFTIGNTPGCTSDRSAYKALNFYGYDLNSPREMDVLSKKVLLSTVLNTGRPIQSEQQFQSQITGRIALLHLADQIGVPAPDQQTLQSYIKTKAAFRGPDGLFSRDAYTDFVDTIESNPSMPQGLLILVLEEDHRIDQIGNALSGPGYLLPSEAIAQTQRTETILKLATAEISYAEFNPEIEVDEVALKTYYTNNTNRYEIPERIRASYIAFPTAKYIDKVPAAKESELRAYFTSNLERFEAAYEADQIETEDTKAEKPTVIFEHVRDSVAAEFATESAKRLANEAAQSFAYRLYRDAVEQDSTAFNELLREYDLKLTSINPYTAEDAARNTLSTEMLESAFALSKSRYFSDAYPIEEGFGVLIYAGRIAPEIPTFETVLTAVTADYKAVEKRRLFNENGIRLKTELKIKLDEGTNFIDAAQALGLKVTPYESFKPREAPRTLNQAALQKAQNMKIGELSPMLTISDTGLFVYLEEKNVPEIVADDENLAQAQNFLKRYAAYVSSSSLLSELIARGMNEPEP